MNSFLTDIGAIAVFVAIVVVFGLLMSLPVMWLWNGCLVPAVSGVKELGWLQSWGMLILCGLLFKNSSASTTSK
jgi:hypothetical protein